MTRVIGFDLALNHGAAVELDDGVFSRAWYVTDTLSVFQLSTKEVIGFRLQKINPKKEDRLVGQIRRLDYWCGFLEKLLDRRKPDFIGIEDYALDGGSHGAHYKGELGGIARMAVWRRGIPMRLHDPMSVKLYVAHRGDAGKTEMVRSVAKRWGQDFSRFVPPPKKKGTPSTDTSEDLADSFGIAKLVWAEVRLRRGELHLSGLEHEKEIQVFQRCTNHYPMSLLSREWILNPQAFALTDT